MLKIKKVYVADNGDIFLIRESNYEEVSKKEVTNLVREAFEMLERGEFEPCIYKRSKIDPALSIDNSFLSKFGSYYTLDGDFLGNEQIHILDKYSQSQEGLYLNYIGSAESLWDNKHMKALIKIWEGK